MKAAKMLVAAEHQAVRQASGFLSAAKKRFESFMRSRSKIDTAAQRRYVREAEKTISDAEKIIKQLKNKVAAAKRSLPRTAKRVKKRAKKKASAQPARLNAPPKKPRVKPAKRRAAKPGFDTAARQTNAQM